MRNALASWDSNSTRPGSRRLVGRRTDGPQTKVFREIHWKRVCLVACSDIPFTSIDVFTPNTDDRALGLAITSRSRTRCTRPAPGPAVPVPACTRGSRGTMYERHREMKSRFNSRRSFLTRTAGAFATTFWADEVLDALPQNTNTNSKPSDLKITDMRVATVDGSAVQRARSFASIPTRASTDTGEVRDGASQELRPDAEEPDSG